MIPSGTEIKFVRFEFESERISIGAKNFHGIHELIKIEFSAACLVYWGIVAAYDIVGDCYCFGANQQRFSPPK